MKKKSLLASLIVVFCFSLIGCGKSNAEPEQVVDTQMVQDEAEGNEPSGEDDFIEESDKEDGEKQKADDESTDKAKTENSEADNESENTIEQGHPVDIHGKLSVKGTQLVDANGKPYQIKGVSTHGINWFPEYVNKDGFQTMRDEWGINCIRLAMYTAESNSYCEGGNKDALKELVSDGVSYATDLGMYVIIDWHILHDLDPNKYKAEALAFFDEMSKKYANNKNVLYEICNEPNGGTSWSQVKSYAEEVIPIIKSNDPDAIIIVGTPTWSQDVDLAAKDPIKGYDNIMYTIHFYADTHRDNIRQKMTSALDAGIPVFCTEFGVCDASGSGANNFDEGNTWIGLMNDKGVSYCIWNLSNKNETSSLIKSGCGKKSGWTKDDLSDAGLWYVDVLGKKLADGDNKSDEKASKETETNSSSKEKTDTSSKENNEIKDDTKADDKKVEQSSKNAKGDLSVSAKCSNNWSDGTKRFYQYDLVIENTGREVVNSWTIQLSFDGDVKIDQSWNGKFEVNGKTVNVKPVDYNTTIEKGQKIDVGFIICSDKEITKVDVVR